MPTYPATVLVLRKTKLGETDTILTLLSDEGAQIRAVAKGARKPGSRFSGSLEQFALCDALLYSGRNLDVITEVRVVDPHRGLHSDYDRTVAASVVSDLLDKVTGDAEAEPVLFGLGLATLEAMETAEPAALKALVAGFLLKSVSLLGMRPSIMSCASCGCTAAGHSVFSHEVGGTLCEACAGVDPGSVTVSMEARDALHALLASTMDEIAGMSLSDRVAGESLATLRSFVAYHVPARLRSMEYLSEQMAAGSWPSVDSAAPKG